MRCGLAAFVAAAWVTACASPPPSDPESATVWGFVRLVPKKDMPAAGGGYGDRRLADVKRFDYSHLRYAVVFAPGVPGRDARPLEVTIGEGRRGVRLDPPVAFASRSQGIAIRNDTDRDQIVSVPDAGWIARIEAGGTGALENPNEGELTLHLLGGADQATPEPALVWVSEGAIVEVDDSGRYVLDRLAPGSLEVRAWHPRLPPTKSIALDLVRGDVHRLDLEIGVDAGDLHHLEEGDAP